MKVSEFASLLGTLKAAFDLFSKDPRLCCDADIEALVADFRAKRHLFNAGAAQAGSTKKLASDVKLSLNVADLLKK